ncbi:MAG: hypothetical protein AAF351_15965 [Pseudomonadota bacterium]
MLLVRDAETAPEAFIMKRRAGKAFGSRYVFPGGVLDGVDDRVHLQCSGIESDKANRLLDVSSHALSYYSAAIRELFEETGLLFADHTLSLKDVATARDALNNRQLAWDTFVTDNELTLQCGRLQYFSHLVTPPGYPKRFCARFFLAKVAADEHAEHDGNELVDSVWMQARDILDARKRKEMKVPWATRSALSRIAKLDNTDDMVRWAHNCGEKGVVCNQKPHHPRDVM